LDKTISGPGLPDNLRWTYQYGPKNQSWSQDCKAAGCVDTKTLEVHGPEGWSRYTFSNRWEHSEGKLLKVEQGSGPGHILRTESTTYLMNPAGQRYPVVMGINPFDRGDRTTEILQPVIRREIRQDGVVFKWEVAQTGGVHDLDHFGRPITITRSSEVSP
jgi:hypothetical protein